MDAGSGAELRVLGFESWGSSPGRGGLWQAGPRQGPAWLQTERTSRLSHRYRLRVHQSLSSMYGSRAGALHIRGRQHAPAPSDKQTPETRTLGFS